MVSTSREESPCKATPLPLRQMAALTLVLLSESFCSTMLLPFVGLLVSHLQQRPVEESGYFSGLLIGIFMFGQVVSGRTWGYVSDVYGRRFPLLFGLFSSGFMMLGFGFSPNVWLCIFFRFFHGLFNGNVLVAKTVLADILDKTNEAKGFVLVSLTFGIGSLLGPAVGGLMYDPANSTAMAWAGFDRNGIFAQFPALLPALVIFFYTYFAIFVCLVFLEESNRKMQPLPAWITAILSFVSLRSSGETHAMDVVVMAEVISHEDKRKVMDEELSIQNSDFFPSSSTEDVPGLKRHSISRENDLHSSVVSWRAEVDLHAEIVPFGYREAFRLTSTRDVLILYMLLSAADIAIAEIFPLWAVATTSAGGLGYHSDLVGAFLLGNSIPCVIGNLAFPFACAAITDKMQLWRISVFVTAPAVLALPFVSYLSPKSHFILVLLLNWVRQWFLSWCFGLITLLTARVAPSGHMGGMYGISQSCGSAMRFIIPVLATPVFAWSISGKHPLPFNHVFVFLLAAMTFVMGALVSYNIDVEDVPGSKQVVVEAIEDIVAENGISSTDSSAEKTEPTSTVEIHEEREGMKEVKNEQV